MNSARKCSFINVTNAPVILFKAGFVPAVTDVVQNSVHVTTLTANHQYHLRLSNVRPATASSLCFNFG
jgi:hypothetical protein